MVTSWALAHGIATLAHQGTLSALRPGQDNETIAERLVDAFGALQPTNTTES